MTTIPPGRQALSGIYAARSALQANMRKAEALANDIANLDTTGYKSTRVSFRDLVDRAGSAATVTGRSWKQGALQETGDPLSLAIEGRGFFQVRREDGALALTRDGSFHLDAQGQIVTAGGERLQPPLTVPSGTDPASIAIGADGQVTANGRPLGRIALVTVAAPDRLRALGETQFAPTSESGPVTAAVGATIHQGHLEASNADLTALVSGGKGFELAARVVATQDRLLEIANDLRR